MLQHSYVTLGSKYIVYNQYQLVINIEFGANVGNPVTGETVR